MRSYRALLIAIILAFAATAFGQDAAKLDLYNKFINNYKKGPEQQVIAREAVKQYLAKYPNPQSEEEKKVTAYVIDWAATYDKAMRRFDLVESLKAKKLDEAFAAAGQVLADDPEDVEIYYFLTGAGYEGSVAGNHKNDVAAIAYAKKAIELFEAGKSLDPAKPLTDAQRADQVGYLYFIVGSLESPTSTADARTHFLKAVQTGTLIKAQPQPYLNIYKMYETLDYKPLTDKYKGECASERLVDTQPCKDLNAQAHAVLDKMIDALARAIAYADVSPTPDRFAVVKVNWRNALIPYYKYRHDGSDTGLDEFIKGVIAKPLPN